MASSADHQTRPLAALFERARAASSAAIEGAESSESLEEAIAACSSAEKAADAAGASPSASSSNAAGETADDLPARDLRWALVPGWEGLLRSKKASCSPHSSLAAKRSALLEASESLRGFLAACQQLGVAPKEALATLAEVDDGGAEDDDDEEEEQGGGSRRPPVLSVGASNPEARRAAKIAAFRARRELQTKLSQLRERAEKRQRERKKKKGVKPSSSEASRDEEDDSSDEDDDDDEEELREAVLAELALTCLSAADEVLAIKEEATVLRHALWRETEAEARGKGGGKGGRAGNGASEEEEERTRREEASAVAAALRGAFSTFSTGDTTAAAAAPRPTFAPASAGAVAASALGGLGLGTSSSVFDRGAAAASVFRPSHLLPTLSLEEFADREVAEARARSERDRARSASAAAAARNTSSADDGGDDGKTEADGGAALDRLRALDDWKDDHPYGYGNSKRRPAATGSK